MRKHDTCDEKLVDKEGAKYARTLLKEVGFSDDTTERVVWLIEHFHNLDRSPSYSGMSASEG